MTVAVVDEGGMLQALSRMDGAPRLSAQIAEAEAKAVGAAILGAVGVSGASSEEDHECAQTALRAVFAGESGG